MPEVRNTVFWRSPFGEKEVALSIGKWMTVVVEVKEAGPRDNQPIAMWPRRSRRKVDSSTAT